MAGIGDFLKSNGIYLVGAFIIAALFRKQIADFTRKISGTVLTKKTQASEIVYRPQPIANGGQFGRTVGQTRVMSDGSVPPMFDRGRAVGQTVAQDPQSEITPLPIPLGPVNDPTTDTQMFNGAFTDGALKYTTSTVGANYSGSAVGATI